MTTPPKPIDLSGLVVLRKELVAQGATDNNIAHMVKSGVLHRIRHGSYVRREHWDPLTREDQHRLLTRAVLRTAKQDTVVTHGSAIIERGVPLWGFPLDTVHTTRSERAGRRRADWIQHRTALCAEDIEEVNGVRVSRAALSAVEITTIASAEASLVAVNRLLHAKAMSLDDFRAEVDACKYWPRTLTANLVLHLADGRLESVGEDRLSYLLHQQMLPRPEPQVPILDEFGQVFARVDFAWARLGVFLEFDGKIKYERFRRPGETLDEFLLREKDREAKICQLTGWTCIRVTWRELATPEILGARIRAILASRLREVS